MSKYFSFPTVLLKKFSCNSLSKYISIYSVHIGDENRQKKKLVCLPWHHMDLLHKAATGRSCQGQRCFIYALLLTPHVYYRCHIIKGTPHLGWPS